MEFSTKNYVIRSFSISDSDEFFEVVHEQFIKKYVPYAYCETREDSREMMADYVKGDCRRDFYLAICKDNKIVGAIIAVEIYKKILDCSLVVSKDYRNQGVMKESLSGFIDWLKENSSTILGLDLVIKKENIASRSLAKSLNAIKVATRKEEDIFRILTK